MPREKIQKLAQIKNLQWLEDPANHELRFLRNKIRKLIIPGLADTSMQFETNLEKMAEIQRNLASYIDDLTEKKIISKLNDRKTVPLILLKNVDAKIKIFVLQSILRRFGIYKLGQKKLEEIPRQVMESKRMKQPSIDVDDKVIKIHKGCLFVLKNIIYYEQKPGSQLWNSIDMVDFFLGNFTLLKP